MARSSLHLKSSRCKVSYKRINVKIDLTSHRKSDLFFIISDLIFLGDHYLYGSSGLRWCLSAFEGNFSTEILRSILLAFQGVSIESVSSFSWACVKNCMDHKWCNWESKAWIMKEEPSLSLMSVSNFDHSWSYIFDNMTVHWLFLSLSRLVVKGEDCL